MRASNDVFVDDLALWLSDDLNATWPSVECLHIQRNVSQGSLRSLNLLDVKKNKETSLPSWLSLLKATLITSDDNALHDGSFSSTSSFDTAMWIQHVTSFTSRWEKYQRYAQKGRKKAVDSIGANGAKIAGQDDKVEATDLHTHAA